MVMKPEWQLTIKRLDNGFLLEGPVETSTDGFPEGILRVEQHRMVLEEKENWDEAQVRAQTGRALAFAVLEYFDMLGSPHDSRRVRIMLERGHKHIVSCPKCHEEMTLIDKNEYIERWACEHCKIDRKEEYDN